VLNDDLTGLALPLTYLAKQPALWTYILSLFSPDKQTLMLINGISEALLAPQVVKAFPELISIPSSRSTNSAYVFNRMVVTHLDIHHYPAYTSLARNIHLGLLRAMDTFDWPTKPSQSLGNMLTCLGSLLNSLNDELLNELKDAQSITDHTEMLEQVKDVIWEVALQATRRTGDRDLPLANSTRRVYYCQFIKLLWNQDEIHPPSDRHSFRRRRSVMHEDGDPPERFDSPDGFSHSRMIKLVQETLSDLYPEESLKQSLMDAVDPNQEGLFIHSDAWSVMREYTYPLDWSALSPQLAALLLSSLKKVDEVLRAVVLSLLFTGRPLDWLLQIDIGSPPGKGFEHPRYIPDWGAVLYFPSVISRLPEKPQSTADLFHPVSSRWLIPLPEVLLHYWNLLAKMRKPGEHLFPVTKKDVRKLLQHWTVSLHRHFPAETSFTVSRLRRTFTTLMLSVGNLDPLLAAMISGQWRIVHEAPLFYTTITPTFLAYHYRLAVRRVWSYLQGMVPNMPNYPDGIQLSRLPRWYQGSPYYPRRSVIQNVFRGLLNRINEAESLDEQHNLRTMLALYGLAVFCGLRISEVSSLITDQIDFNATWNGQNLPWIVLPDAKGNRFTTASRIVPIPEPLIPLLKSLIPSEMGVQAFSFMHRGQSRPATIDTIRHRLERIQLPFPRWHAGRHLLRIHLMQQGMNFDSINLIMGHQSAGREAYNPFVPDLVLSTYQRYRHLSGCLARSLGWKEGFCG